MSYGSDVLGRLIAQDLSYRPPLPLCVVCMRARVCVCVIVFTVLDGASGFALGFPQQQSSCY